MVVCTWTLAAAAGRQREFSPGALAALFFTVWAIYLADRLVDVARCRDWSQATGRMHFGRRYRRTFVSCLAGTVAANLILLIAGVVPRDAALRALWVGVAMVGYALLFVVPLIFGKRLPGKEFCVGLFFAAGAWAAMGGPAVDFPLICIAALVAFNCLLISARETETDAVIDPSSAGQWWRTIRRDLVWVGIVAAGCTLTVPTEGARYVSPFVLFCASVFLAFGGMVWLHAVATRCSADSVRALADFCLLAPWLWLPFLW